LTEIINFIVSEKEWLFSGIGVFILSFIIYKKNKASNIMKQNLKNNSFAIQAGKNVNINLKKD